MLLKKKNFKKKQLLIRFFFKKIELKKTLKLSLLKNHYNHYEQILSFTFVKNKQNKFLFFKCRQKLICLHTLGKKVPSKKFQFSRFFLNKQLNFLKINNTAT